MEPAWCYRKLIHRRGEKEEKEREKGRRKRRREGR